MKRRLLLVVNVDWFFVSHRLPVALAAIRKGYEVHVATAITDLEEELNDLGLIVHHVPFVRSHVGFLHEVKTFWHLFRLIKTLRPDVIHAVTSKPNLYAGMAAKILGISNVVLAVSGLGLVFVAAGWRARVRRSLVLMMYRIAINPQQTRFVFQNESDKYILDSALPLHEINLSLIRGSGVDLDEYSYTEQSGDGKFVVCMASRLLREKGVYDFIAAAYMIAESESGAQIQFQLVGDVDTENPSSVSKKELRKWSADGVVDCLGFRSDIPRIFSEANLVVLPSYYGEGLPKVLIEAAACGRAIITADCPGCRDAVIPGKTGLIVPPRNASALATAILQLFNDRDLVSNMGREGRRYAEETFSIHAVVSEHLTIYDAMM